MVECACNLARGLGVPDHPQLRSEFEVSLGYMSIKKEKKKKNERSDGDHRIVGRQALLSNASF